MPSYFYIFALTKLLIKIVMMQRGNQDTETKILKAAEEEFMQKGYAGARTTSIAEKAGVTHAMFHYYFRTKDKIFEKIVSEKVGKLKEIIGASLTNPSLSLSETVRTIIHGHLDFLSKNRDLPRFLIGEIYSHPEQAESIKGSLRAFALSMLGRLQDKIDEAVSKGECREIRAENLMLDIVSLNVFPYMGAPLVNAALNGCMEDNEAFLELRKKENYDTIMRKLKP